MPKDRDEETGRYLETYPLDVFIEALDSRGGSASTQEIADMVGCAYRTAYARLRELEDEDRVSSRKIGNALLWRIT